MKHLKSYKLFELHSDTYKDAIRKMKYKGEIRRPIKVNKHMEMMKLKETNPSFSPYEPEKDLDKHLYGTFLSKARYDYGEYNVIAIDNNIPRNGLTIGCYDNIVEIYVNVKDKNYVAYYDSEDDEIYYVPNISDLDTVDIQRERVNIYDVTQEEIDFLFRDPYLSQFLGGNKKQFLEELEMT